MKFHLKRPRTLAIIGNGFDLNHGYLTDYKSFAKSTNDPDLQKFKEFCDIEDIETWYLFEENIRILSEKLFLKSMSENADFEDNRREVKELARIFKRIHVLLKEYLARETASRPLVMKSCIAKHLNRNTVAINFNYTATAEAYTKNIIYVHGSLKEENILLGYDYRDEPCLAQFEDMQWSKDICRETLAFRRHFLSKKKYASDDAKYEALLSGLQAYQHWENTGRGIDDEVKTFIPEYDTVHRFLSKHRQRFPIPKLNYKKIKTLVVLGHGIEADKKFLNEIAGKCTTLETVVIYRHEGEDANSFNAKVSFFAPYCSQIEQIDY